MDAQPLKRSRQSCAFLLLRNANHPIHRVCSFFTKALGVYSQAFVSVKPRFPWCPISSSVLGGPAPPDNDRPLRRQTKSPRLRALLPSRKNSTPTTHPPVAPSSRPSLKVPKISLARVRHSAALRTPFLFSFSVVIKVCCAFFLPRQVSLSAISSPRFHVFPSSRPIFDRLCFVSNISHLSSICQEPPTSATNIFVPGYPLMPSSLAGGWTVTPPSWSSPQFTCARTSFISP